MLTHRKNDLGVVTVTYNSKLFLDEFLDSCNRQNLSSYKIYCIDNASVDGTPDLLRAIQDSRWELILNDKNLGVAEGNNQGIQQALQDGCEWILLLNNDTVFEADFFSQLLHFCITQQKLVAVPKMLFDTPINHIWFAGGGFNPKKGWTGYHVGKGEKDIGQHDNIQKIEYSPTCAMLVHHSVFRQVGLMDESYFVYFDDTDFCWRLKQAAIPIWYYPKTSLVHKVGGSTGGAESPFTIKMTSRNRLYYLRKVSGLTVALLWIPIFFSYYTFMLISGKWQFKAYKAALLGSFSFLKITSKIPDIVASN